MNPARRCAAIALGAALVVALAACAAPVESSVPSPRPTAIASSGSVAPASPDPSAAATGGSIEVDEGLLDILPAQVAGVALVSDPATAAAIASDPDLATTAAAIAVAYAIVPGASGGEDVAVVSVVKLAPGVYDDAVFRAWRDTYDAAACEPAGGVSGHAQAEIGGRETFIGTCAQGAFTYHVHLEDPDRFVSITSVGERRLGEQVVAELGE